MLAASKQCWRMVRALRSHGRCWLVVSSDEMSPCASRSRTSSVTDRRLILTCQPHRTTRKIFVSSVEHTLLWCRWQQKRSDLSNGWQSLHSTLYLVHLLPVISPTDFNLSATTTLMWFYYTTSMCRLKFFHYSVETPYWLSSRDVII